MTIAICDDEPLELENTRLTVADFIANKHLSALITVHTYLNANDLLHHIEKYGGFDMLILDIIMPGINGIELAQEIRRHNSSCIIIFLTSSPEYAVTSYNVNAFNYLLKPFVPDELRSLLNKALMQIEDAKSTSIIIKEAGKLTRVQIHAIQYVECMKHTLHFHLRNNDILTCHSPMYEFNDILMADKRFIKCHKSFIVNLNFVMSISSKDFIMNDKTLIPISRQVYQQIKNAYIDYFFEKGDICR